MAMKKDSNKVWFNADVYNTTTSTNFHDFTVLSVKAQNFFADLEWVYFLVTGIILSPL